MSKELLIIFIKNPVIGKVKTRLAATIGVEAAFEVYQKLLDHTLQITIQLDKDKVVFYSDFIAENDAWKENGFHQQLQKGIDLGEKMKYAFQYAFENHYRKSIIIGSDCFELNTALINQAFEHLNESDMVIGPTIDGGYYLIGMKMLHNDIFNNKLWSSGSVYSDTIQDIHCLQLSYSDLPMLSDVDEEKDVPTTIRQH